LTLTEVAGVPLKLTVGDAPKATPEIVTEVPEYENQRFADYYGNNRRG